MSAGSSGMAQNFNDSSIQGVMMVTVDTQTAGSEISLTNSNGDQLISWTSEKEYSSVIVSCAEITEGETYTLTAGNSTQEITMESLVYGIGEMGGKRGSGQGHNGEMKDRSMPKQDRQTDDGTTPRKDRKMDGEAVPGQDQQMDKNAI